MSESYRMHLIGSRKEGSYRGEPKPTRQLVLPMRTVWSCMISGALLADIKIY
jgi:hypothetical protein